MAVLAGLFVAQQLLQFPILAAAYRYIHEGKSSRHAGGPSSSPLDNRKAKFKTAFLDQAQQLWQRREQPSAGPKCSYRGDDKAEPKLVIVKENTFPKRGEYGWLDTLDYGNGTSLMEVEASERAGTATYVRWRENTFGARSCSSEEYDKFAEQFHTNPSRIRKEAESIANRPPCDDNNVLWLYPKHDHNGAFELDEYVCYRAVFWHQMACSVTIVRVASVYEATTVLREFGIGSIGHFVIGGHGSGSHLRLGPNSVDGSSLKVNDGPSEAFLQEAGLRMRHTSTVFLDSCFAATSQEMENLVRHTARLMTPAMPVGSDLTVYGSVHALYNSHLILGETNGTYNTKAQLTNAYGTECVTGVCREPKKALQIGDWVKAHYLDTEQKKSDELQAGYVSRVSEDGRWVDIMFSTLGLQKNLNDTWVVQHAPARSKVEGAVDEIGSPLVRMTFIGQGPTPQEAICMMEDGTVVSVPTSSLRAQKKLAAGDWVRAFFTNRANKRSSKSDYGWVEWSTGQNARIHFQDGARQLINDITFIADHVALGSDVEVRMVGLGHPLIEAKLLGQGGLPNLAKIKLRDGGESEVHIWDLRPKDAKTHRYGPWVPEVGSFVRVRLGRDAKSTYAAVVIDLAKEGPRVHVGEKGQAWIDDLFPDDQPPGSPDDMRIPIRNVTAMVKPGDTVQAYWAYIPSLKAEKSAVPAIGVLLGVHRESGMLEVHLPATLDPVYVAPTWLINARAPDGSDTYRSTRNVNCPCSRRTYPVKNADGTTCLSSFCCNSDGDARGPWCLVDNPEECGFKRNAGYCSLFPSSAGDAGGRQASDSVASASTDVPKELLEKEEETFRNIFEEMD